MVRRFRRRGFLPEIVDGFECVAGGAQKLIIASIVPAAFGFRDYVIRVRADRAAMPSAFFAEGHGFP